MNDDDVIRLRHMREAAEEAIGYIEDLDRTSLDTNTMLMRALTMCIGIIGEVSARISAETREEIPQLPWTLMIGMRNRLIHAYYDINRDRVWSTVKEDLPPLVTELDKILEGYSGSEVEEER